LIGQAQWAAVKRIVLWLGLFLCGYALWRARALAGDAIARVSPVGWICVCTLLMAIWVLAVFAWRQYLRAYMGQDPGWRAAMRQVGLLLVGKYVPGGVFGFLARMYDQPNVPRQRLFWAGLAEQAVGVSMPVALGGVLYMAATEVSLAWLWLIALLPLLALLGVWSLHRCAGWLPWLRKHAVASGMPVWPRFLLAAVAQVAQLLAWVSLVFVLVHDLYGMDGFSALGVAGAFLLAVAAGMVMVLAPGGIGVREAALVGLASHWLGTAQAIFMAALLRILSSLLDVFAGWVATLSRSLEHRND